MTQEYVLSNDDVKATNGSDKVVTLNKPVTMDLGGYALDLNGFTLKIASETEGALVTIKNGTVKNGVLDISVPNGDIEFDTAVIAETVDYELEAASQTIRFSNVTSSGKGTVKSDTHIQISYSEMADISLAGNGSLEAGEGTKLGKLSVSQSAAGAKVVISPTAKVTSLAIQAKADVNIAGTVEDVEVKAVAKVAVTGEVKKVSVTAEATSETESAEISIAPTAVVDNVDLKAKTTLDVQGVVSNVVVGASATGTKVSVSGDHATAGRVVVSAEDTVLETENADAIQNVLVSSEVASKVEIPQDVKQEVVEDATILEKVHTYVVIDEKVATCTEAGYKVYKCSEDGCEDSYTVNVPTKPHAYEESIVQLPSQIATGIKKHTCSVCGNSYETKIPALELQSDSLYQLICLLVGDSDMSLVVGEGSKITVYKESTDYAYGDGFRNEVAINVAKASISIKDGEPYGFIQFEVVLTENVFTGEGDIKTFVDENAEEKVVSFDVYVNEGIVYVDVNNNGEFGSTIGLKALDQLLSQSTNGAITVETIYTAIELYTFSETAFDNYAPFVEAVKKALASKEDVDASALFVEFFDEYLIAEEELQDGSGTLYTLDVNGLATITDTFAEKTLAEVIEEEYGEGTVDTIVEKLKSVPTLTVKEIADSAIALAEEYKFDVDYTFALIETYIEMVAGVEISIQEKLEENYELTIIDIIMSMTGTAGPSGGTIGGEGPNGGVVDGPIGGVVGDKEFIDKMSVDTINDDVIGGGVTPGPMTKEQMIEMFETMVDGYAEQVKTLTIDQLFNVLVYKDMEYKPVIGEDENGPIYAEDTFALSASLKGLYAMANEMVTVQVLVDAEGAITSVYGELPDGISVVYNVTEGVYTMVGYYGLYELKVDYTPETKEGLATLSVYNEQTELYEAVYTATLTHNGEDYKYLFEIEELIKIGLNYAIDEDGLLAFDGILSVLGYTVEADVSEADQTGTISVLMGENLFAEIKLENTETGKLATVQAMGYKLILNYVTEDSVVEAVLYKYDSSIYEYVEMYSLGMAFEGETFDFNAVIEVADELFAEVVASWDITDLATIINGSVTTAMGYNLTFDANSEDKTVSAILTAGEGTESVEMGKVVVGTDEEGFTVADVYVMLNKVATLSYKGVDATDYNTKLEVVVGENKIATDVKVETLSDGKYKITMVSTTEAEGTEITQKMEYIIGFTQEETTETVYFEALVSMVGDMFSTSIEDTEGTVVFDGIVEFDVTKGENGETEKVDVDVDVDKYLVMLDPESVEGIIINTVKSYIDADFDVTIDFTKSEEFEGELEETVTELVSKIESVKVDYEDEIYTDGGILAFECKDAEDGNGKYLEIKEKVEYGIGRYTEYVSLIPIVDGCVPNGVITVSDICKDWISVAVTVLAEASVNEYDEEGRPQYDEPTYVSRQIDIRINANLVTGEIRRMEEGVHDDEITIEKLGETCEDGYKATFTCKDCGDAETYTYYDCVYINEYEFIGETLCGEVEAYKNTCICCGDEDHGLNYHNCYLSWAPIENFDSSIDAVKALNVEGFVEEDFLSVSASRYVCHWCGLEKMEYTIYCYNEASNHCYAINHDVLTYQGQFNEVTGETDYEPFEYKLTYKYDECLSRWSTIETVYYDDDEAITEDDAKYLDYLRLVFSEDLIKVEDLWLGSVSIGGCPHCKEVNYVELSATTAYKVAPNKYENGDLDVELYFEDGEFEYAYINRNDNPSSDWDLRLFKKLVAPYIGKVSDDYTSFPEKAIGVLPEGNIYADGTMDLRVEFIIEKQYVDHADGSEHTYSDVVYVEIYSRKDYENCGAKVGYYDVQTCEITWYVYDKAGNYIGSTDSDKHDYIHSVRSETVSCTEEGVKSTTVCLICDKQLGSWTDHYHSGGYTAEADLDTYYDFDIEETKGFTSTSLNASGRYHGWYCVHCEKFEDLKIWLTDDWVLDRDVYLYAENIEIDLAGYSIDLNGYNLIVYGINGSEVIVTDSTNTFESAIYDTVGTGNMVLFSYHGYIDLTFVNVECVYLLADTDSRETIKDTFFGLYGKELNGYVDWAN
ncbi:MAG: hypothetical protein IKA12_03675 [Clostridia bacterium]|nr:hypothetical protein [Clostridia bacterium]